MKFRNRLSKSPTFSNGAGNLSNGAGNSSEGDWKFENTLADLMFGEDEKLPERLREQEENLKKEKCAKSEIGKWLEDFELPVLLEILNSSDDYFNESFPEMKSFNRLERQEFAGEIEEHVKICHRCGAKVKYDLEWEKEVEASISGNKQTLKKSLED